MMKRLHFEAVIAFLRGKIIKEALNLLPALILGVVFAVYIFSVCSLETGIRVSVNGEEIGLLPDRKTIVEAEAGLEKQLSDIAETHYMLGFTPSYELVRVRNPVYLTAGEYSEKLYSYVEDDFCTASVLYIDGVQAAASFDREALSELLLNIQSEMLESAGEGFDVAVISNSIRIEDKACLSSLVMSIDEINSLINPLADEKAVRDADVPSTEDVYDGGEISFSTVKTAAPLVSDTGSAGDIYPDKPEDLVLDYTLTCTAEVEQTVKFRTEYIDDYNRFIGTEYVMNEGSDGKKLVTYKYVYNESGELIDSIILEESIITPVVNKIVMRGAALIPEAVPTGTFIWPCNTPRGISSPYGWREVYGKTEFHLGIDLPDSKGSPIWASDGGEVVWAGYTPSYGYSIRIEHKDGYMTLYAHLSKMKVKVGDHVYQGQQIGEMGSTGMSYGSHLHFEVRIDGKTYDPVKYLPKQMPMSE